MPSIWGLHNYSDINRLESWRTRELIKAFGGQVWLTETGGIVQFRPSFTNTHGSGLTRAAKVLKYMFAVAAAHPQIKRLYIYDWSGGNSSTRFDAGLMNAHEQPRPGYVVVCKAAARARTARVKTATQLDQPGEARRRPARAARAPAARRSGSGSPERARVRSHIARERASAPARAA